MAEYVAFNITKVKSVTKVKIAVRWGKGDFKVFIETTSQARMERDLAAYLNIQIDELYQYIDCAAERAQTSGQCH